MKNENKNLTKADREVIYAYITFEGVKHISMVIQFLIYRAYAVPGTILGVEVGRRLQKDRCCKLSRKAIKYRNCF